MAGYHNLPQIKMAYPGNFFSEHAVGAYTSVEVNNVLHSYNVSKHNLTC